MIMYVRISKEPLVIMEGPKELPKAFANITGFHRLSNEELAKYGWHPFESYHEVESQPAGCRVVRKITLEDGKVISKASVFQITEAERVRELSELRRATLSRLSTIRWEKESGGVVVNGVTYPTSRESRSTLALNVAAGLEVRWKVAPRQWISIDAGEAGRISKAIASHVASCFSNEERLEARIISAQTADEIRGIDLDEGWPS